MFTIKAYSDDCQRTYEAMSYNTDAYDASSDGQDSQKFYFKDANDGGKIKQIDITNDRYAKENHSLWKFEGCADKIIIENSNGKTTDIFRASTNPEAIVKK